MKKTLVSGGMVAAIVLALLAFAACSAASPTASPSPSPSTTPSATPSTTPSPTPTTAASVEAYANPITEAMLEALNNNDYGAFSKDFNQSAKSAITESVFGGLYSQVHSTIGSYQSLLFFGFSVQGANTTVGYVTQYSEEPAGVSVAVVFQTVNGTHYVDGFTMDSPKLRGQSLDVQAIRSYTDPDTENVLVSLSADNYVAFSQDFDATLKSALDEAAFQQLYDKINGTVGQYVSVQFESLSEQNTIVTCRYLADYSEEPSGVWVTISFDPDQKIAGLFFSSPKINEE